MGLPGSALREAASISEMLGDHARPHPVLVVEKLVGPLGAHAQNAPHGAVEIDGVEVAVIGRTAEGDARRLAASQEQATSDV